MPGVAGTWKDLTDTVNVMAANLTEQVRGIVKVVTAVANGDLKQALTVKSKGEVAALGETINNMIDTLAAFADQVTTVAREVGVEGRLGGQANVPGAAGMERPDQQRQPARRQPDQPGARHRRGGDRRDHRRPHALDPGRCARRGGRAQGLHQYDDRQPPSTTERNTEQDWLKTNLARFTSMLQGQRDLATVGSTLLSELVPIVGAHQGMIYQMDAEAAPHLKLLAKYADDERNGYPARLELGQGFIGQCALDRRRILVSEVPPDTIRIGASLIDASRAASSCCPSSSRTR